MTDGVRYPGAAIGAPGGRMAGRQLSVPVGAKVVLPFVAADDGAVVTDLEATYRGPVYDSNTCRVRFAKDPRFARQNIAADPAFTELQVHPHSFQVVHPWKRRGVREDE